MNLLLFRCRLIFLSLLAVGGSWPLVAQSVHADYEEALRLGDEALDQNHFEKALHHYRLSRQILAKASPADSLQWATLFNKLGNYFREIKDCERGREYLQRSLDIRLQQLGPNDLTVADVYNNMGNCWNASGDVQKALDYHRRALAIRKAGLKAPHTAIAQSYNNLGISLVDKGDYQKALMAFQNAFDHYRACYDSDHPDIADVYVNMGDVYHQLDQLDFFVAYQNMALDIYQNTLGSDHGALATCYNNLANAHSRQGDYLKATEFYQKAIDIRQKKYGEVHPDIAESRFNLAMTALFEEKYSPSEEYFQQCFAALGYTQAGQFDAISDPHILMNALEGYGELLILQYQLTAQLSQLESALSQLEQASQLIDFLRVRYEAVGSKLRLFERAHQIYDRAIELCQVLRQTTGQDSYLHQAFAYSEKSKGILLLEALKKSNAEGFAGVPPALLQDIKTMERRINTLEKERFLRLEHPGENTQRTLDSLSALIFDENNRLSQTLARMAGDFSDYYQLRYETTTVPVEWIQQEWLRPGQSIVEYFLGESQLHCFIIDRERFELRSISLPTDFYPWLQGFVAAIRNYHQVASAQLSENIRQYNLSAYALFQTLIAPIQDILHPELIVITDGALGRVPFEALLSRYPEQEDDFTGHPYLLNDYQLSYNYSVTLLKEMTRPRGSATLQPYVGFAPVFSASDALGLSGLRHNQEEIREVQQLMGGVVYLGDEATKTNYLREQAHYQIVHLATHAKVNRAEGDYSFLAFSQRTHTPDEQPPLLYVKDLYNHPIRAELVVLSACETGTGEMQIGEGIASIARGFSYAGAKSLLATQWSVDDRATKELMTSFFEQLKKGRAKDEALRESKLAFIHQKAKHKAHPYYWASFVGIGHMGPISVNKPWSPWILGIGLFLIIFGWMIAGRRWTRLSSFLHK